MWAFVKSKLVHTLGLNGDDLLGFSLCETRPIFKAKLDTTHKIQALFKQKKPVEP